MLIFCGNLYRRNIRKGVTTDERRKALGNYEGCSKVSDPDGLSRKETNSYPSQSDSWIKLYPYLEAQEKSCPGWPEEFSKATQAFRV